jgi:hypothetical protein
VRPCQGHGEQSGGHRDGKDFAGDVPGWIAVDEQEEHERERPCRLLRDQADHQAGRPASNAQDHRGTG